MTIYLMPADAFGCGHYRMIWPAEVLFNEGHEVRVYEPNKTAGLNIRVEYDEDGYAIVRQVEVPADIEALVLQRPANPMHPQVIRIIRDRKIPVIVDMDDDMSNIHPLNTAFNVYRHNHRMTGGGWNETIVAEKRKDPKMPSHKYAAESCKLASLVVTSTKELQRVYARHGRGVVIDNYVPEACLSFEKKQEDDDLVFGWAGHTHAHPDDLQVVGNGVQRVIDDGFTFKIVGQKSKARQNLRLKEEPYFTGSTPVADWVRTIAMTLDVGMAPLAATAFNRSKSRLKPIEMMSVGVPWVASPREEYRRVAKESGCGLLADTPKAWYESLKRLLTDDVFRKEQSEAGKVYMRSQTYEANAWRWWEAWQYALDLEKSGKVPAVSWS